MANSPPSWKPPNRKLKKKGIENEAFDDNSSGDEQQSSSGITKASISMPLSLVNRRDSGIDNGADSVSVSSGDQDAFTPPSNATPGPKPASRSKLNSASSDQVLITPTPTPPRENFDNKTRFKFSVKGLPPRSNELNTVPEGAIYELRPPNEDRTSYTNPTYSDRLLPRSTPPVTSSPSLARSTLDAVKL